MILESDDRVLCDDCLPEFKAERTAGLVRAAKSTLATMRHSDNDPAKTPEAIAKRVAKVAQRKDEARVWEMSNPGPYDSETFRNEILPGICEVSLPTMMRATGLTSSYCWRIRRGERIPHPMHWAVLRELAMRARKEPK